MEASKSSGGSRNSKNVPDPAASKNMKGMAQSMGTVYQSVRETSSGQNKAFEELETKLRD